MEEDRGHADQLQITYSDRTFTASFKVNPELWSTFKTECKIKGVSVCHVLEALIQAWIEGQRAQSTVIKPVTVNLTMQHVVQRPRRMQTVQDLVLETKAQKWPPNCPDADEFWKGSKEVGCLRRKDFLSLDQCWRCYLEKMSSPEASQV